MSTRKDAENQRAHQRTYQHNSASKLMDFLDKLGIDWRLLIAQLVNFAILFFVLRKFLYKPIIEVLEKRRKQIEENSEKTKNLEIRLQKSDEMYKQKIKEAEQKSLLIVKEAEEIAKKLKTDMLENAKQETEVFLKEANDRSVMESAKILEEVKRESEVFIKESVRKILRSISDEKTTQLFMEKAKKELG